MKLHPALYSLLVELEKHFSGKSAYDDLHKQIGDILRAATPWTPVPLDPKRHPAGTRLLYRSRMFPENGLTDATVEEWGGVEFVALRYASSKMLFWKSAMETQDIQVEFVFPGKDPWAEPIKKEEKPT